MRTAAFSIAVAACVAAGSALAADLPLGAAPDPYPSPVPAERFDWSGFYFGAHTGWQWSDFDTGNGVTGSFTNRDNGVIGGVHGGYNFMLTPSFLLGAEADFTFSDIEDTRSVAGVTYRTSTDWSSNIRGRAGWVFDRFLVFGTGGLAIAEIDASANGVSDEATKVGWTIGAGVESMVTENITARLEYLYQDFGDETFTLGGQAYETDLNNNQVRFGVSYKF